MELTIYSKNFEDKEDVSQNGFADNVFVEDYNDGISFYNCDDNLCDAIKYIVNENIDIDKITYCYSENGDLKYKRFIIKDERKEKENLMPYDCNSSKLGSNPGSSCASRDGAKFKSK